jgi:hypothetical protein
MYRFVHMRVSAPCRHRAFTRATWSAGEFCRRVWLESLPRVPTRCRQLACHRFLRWNHVHESGHCRLSHWAVVQPMTQKPRLAAFSLRPTRILSPDSQRICTQQSAVLRLWLIVGLCRATYPAARTPALPHDRRISPVDRAVSTVCH